MAADNVYFPYLLSYHFAGGTSDCEVAVLNSIEPLTSEPTMKLYDYGYPNSLVKRLETAGYHTLAFHGNRAGCSSAWSKPSATAPTRTLS